MPGGTHRNWESYGNKISVITEEQKSILADPQTSGGLLVSVDAAKSTEFEKFSAEQGIVLKSFGKLVKKREKMIYIK